MSAAAGGGRLVSLDVFRGATIIAMIVVNNPGTWSAVYPPLLHAEWHGWTPTDLIFPFFLFIVGVAVALAYAKRLDAGASRRDLMGMATRRALVLFALGLFMAAWPFFTITPEFGLRPALSTLRIPGVLQRIALCYFAVAALVLFTSPRTQMRTLVALLLGYWAALMLVPVPGVGAGQIGAAETTLAAWIDRAVFGQHLWVGTDRLSDPEGLLSTLPAIATTLFGVWTGRLLLDSDRTPTEKTVELFRRGVILVIVGTVWGWFFPINKPLWTSSYAVMTAGQAMCALALCYWSIDVRGRVRFVRPFVVYGVNAITVFVMSGIVAKTLIILQVGDGAGGTRSVHSWIFETLFLPLASPVNASLLFALAWVAAWWLVLELMYRRGLVIKV